MPDDRVTGPPAAAHPAAIPVSELPAELAVLLRLDRRQTWPTDAVDVATLVALATHHRLDGRLATRAAGTPLDDDTLVPVRDAHDRRERRFRTEVVPQLEELCRALGARGIVPTLLKGASLVLSGTSPAGERPLGDLDVLVAPHERGAARAAVDALGYRPVGGARARDWTTTNHYQDPPLEHPEHRLGVDLHWSLQHPRHRHRFDERTLHRVELPVSDSCVARRLDDVEELAHLCRHTWGDRATGHAGALGQLWDVADASARLDASGWRRLAASTATRGHGDVVAAVVALVHVLLDQPAPPLPAVHRLAQDERLRSFAYRRVLAPRPPEAQLLAVTPDVPYRPWRVATRVVAQLRGGPHGGGEEAARAAHRRHVLRLLAGSLRSPLDARAEARLDRWAHDLT